MTLEQKKALALARARRRRAEAESNQPDAGKPSTETTADDDFSLMEMVRNIPASGVQFGKDIATPILHPVDTAQSVYNLALGVASKAIPGEQESEAYADQVGQFIKERYGSWDAFKQSSESDPVGVLADVAGLLTGGSLTAVKTGGTVGKLGQTLNKVGKAIDPVNLGVKTTAYGAGKMIPKAAPRTLYREAAKFSGKGVDPAQVTEVALRERIMPTDAGKSKLAARKAETGQEIGDVYKAASEAGITYPADIVLKNMGELKQRLGGYGPNAAADTKKLNKLIDDFLEDMQERGITEVTPEDLRKFKTDADNRINWNRSKQKGAFVKEEFHKQMANTVREMSEEIDPRLPGLNKRYSELSALEEPLEAAAKRVGNRYLAGGALLPMVGASGGGLFGDIPSMVGGMAVGTGAGVLTHPRTRSKAALMAEALRNRDMGNFLQNRTAPLLGRQALLQSGRLQQQEEPVIPMALRSQ